jgi:mxaK protein
MKRRRVHLLFGLMVTTLGVLAACHGWQLVHAGRINAAITNAGVAGLDSAVPEARFARASALSGSGDFEAAAKAYKELVQGDRADLKQAALFNLGNLHMREALKNGGAGTGAALPLLELAKQNYRDLLRDDPQAWDARYNLERALWLAPEGDDQDSAENNVPQWERRVAPRAQGFNVELP